jgi:hypothetical protein
LLRAGARHQHRKAARFQAPTARLGLPQRKSIPTFFISSKNSFQHSTQTFSIPNQPPTPTVTTTRCPGHESVIDHLLLPLSYYIGYCTPQPTMSPEEPWPIMPDDQSLPILQVPPTRPSTPTLEHRFERIAEAPSRADHYLPPVETSSPIRAVTPTTVAPLVEEFDRVTLRGPRYEDMAQDAQHIDQNGHAGSAVSIDKYFIDLFTPHRCCVISPV